MWFLTFLSIAAKLLHVAILFVALAAGLFYATELIEEFTSTAEKVIRYTIYVVVCIYPLLYIFESFPLLLCAAGCATHIMHIALIQHFPTFKPLSVPFITAVVLFPVNHYLAITYFNNTDEDRYFDMSEMLAYFTICVWLVPFTLLLSLTANELTLPTITDYAPMTASTSMSTSLSFDRLRGDQDAISTYIGGGRAQNKYSLKLALKWLGDTLLPKRQSKHYN